MVGDFFVGNNAPGLHNKEWFPLRTATPTLAIRHMVPGDFVFMYVVCWRPRETLWDTRLTQRGQFLTPTPHSRSLDEYAKPVQRGFLESFVSVFGDTDAPEVAKAREALAAL